MSMRSQVYEWANLSTTQHGNFMLRRGLNATAVTVPVDREISVFHRTVWKQHYQTSRNNRNTVCGN